MLVLRFIGLFFGVFGFAFLIYGPLMQVPIVYRLIVTLCGVIIGIAGTALYIRTSKSSK